MGKGAKRSKVKVSRESSHSPILEDDEPLFKGMEDELGPGDLPYDGGVTTYSNSAPVTRQPGVPECDIILKGSTRCWYLEMVLFLFGIIGMVISAILLIRHYLNASENI